MLIDFSTITKCIVGIGGTCLERWEGSETEKLILVQGVDLPFVTLKLVRGTTALEVNAPPDHYSTLEYIQVHWYMSIVFYLLAVGAVAQGGQICVS